MSDSSVIQSLIDAASVNLNKVVTLENRDYLLTSGIIIKQGVKLVGGYNTRLVVQGNFRVFELQKDASLEGAYIAIDDPNFNSYVIYLDGKYKYYNIWERTIIRNCNIINWTGTNKGTAIQLYSNGTEYGITFIDFENIRISGFQTGVRLQAVKPASGKSWVNGNRFINFSMEDCINMVTITSGESVPNECTGNIFSNMQIQPSTKTTKLFTISGQYNRLDGMAWDLNIISTNPLVEFVAASSYNTVKFRSIPASRTIDRGRFNSKE
ncbi:hypothetical protein SAMN04488137_3399 [Fictibacillus solisalsi]|uniref:Right handed beta helix region n=1 Tax=Fictibacillus solisalsi TaxID=459525 RepID=A0A1G9YH21_9BACL|nr:hypothetical protein [Fictibacillus solisalsi]SDN07846.1 hypothetical protein SAMN04488137_3399 [Fictibacillus solisalsi]